MHLRLGFLYTGVEVEDVDVDVWVGAEVDVASEVVVVAAAAMGAGGPDEEGVPVPPRIGRRRCRVLFVGIPSEDRVCGGARGGTAFSPSLFSSEASVAEVAVSVKWRPAWTRRIEDAGREVRRERRCWRCWIGVDEGTVRGMAR